MTQGTLSVLCLLIFCTGNAVGVCPEGYQQAYTECYRVYTEKKSWTDARETCRKEFADLAKVDDDDSVTAMQKLASHVHPHYWIGLTDLVTEGKFVWLDGTMLVNPNWDLRQKQPNGGTLQNCVVGEPKEAVWEDKDCQETYSFVCQFMPGIEAERYYSHVSTIITDKALQQQHHVLDRKSALCREDCARYCINTPACDIFKFQEISNKDDNCLLGFYGPVTSPLDILPGTYTYRCPIRYTSPVEDSMESILPNTEEKLEIPQQKSSRG